MVKEQPVMSVGAGTEQVPSIRSAKNRGLSVIAVDADRKAPGFAFADKTYTVSIAEEETIVRIAGRNGIRAVIPAPIGRYLTTIGAINDRLRLRGVTRESAILCTDKMAFHEAAVQAGVCRPMQVAARDPDDIVNIAHQMGFPCILKPRHGSGSRGVLVVDREMARAIISEHCQTRPPGEMTLVEQMVSGSSYGIDAVVENGVPRLILLREKKMSPPPYRVEIEHAAPSRLPGTAIARVKESMQKICAALGLSDTLMHADVVIDANLIPYIIEAAARPSGLGVSSDMVPAVTGVDYIGNGIDLALGVSRNWRVETRCSAVFRLLDLKRGVLRRKPDLTELGAAVTVISQTANLRPGDTIRVAASVAEYLRIGSVLAAGPSLRVVREAIDRYMEAFIVDPL